MTKNKSLEDLFKIYDLDVDEIEQFKKIIGWVDMESKGDSVDSKKYIKNAIEGKLKDDN